MELLFLKLKLGRASAIIAMMGPDADCMRFIGSRGRYMKRRMIG